jgi:hypothetical protein
MSFVKFYVFACDHSDCKEGPDAVAKLEGRNVWTLRQELAKRGWRVNGYGQDFCPDCAKRDAPTVGCAP